jgi:hypothetical protein
VTVSTLRPNSTLENTSNVTGAASAHAALADDSDGSYLTFDPGEYLIATFDDLALPSGALIKRSQLRARVAKQSANGNLTSFLQMATFSANDAAWVSWLSPTQITVGEIDATGIADSDVDAAAFGLAWSLSSGTCRAYEAYLDVTLVERPEVTAVTAPTGTVADTNRPTVAWTRDLDADGGPQTAYQVRVFTDAQYGAGGFDPATSTPFASTQGGFSGANDASVSWQVDTILPDDTYRAYVRIAQRVNGAYHWSDWEYSEFEVDVALPDPPTINVSDDPANARITITITPGIGGATSDAFLLERTYDGGATWLPVRQLDAGLLPVGDPATIVYDYEAPLGVDVSYRAAALHDYSGVHAYSAFDTGSENLEDVADWWLKHSGRSTRRVPSPRREHAGRRQRLARPEDRHRHIQVHEPRRASCDRRAPGRERDPAPAVPARARRPRVHPVRQPSPPADLRTGRRRVAGVGRDHFRRRRLPARRRGRLAINRSTSCCLETVRLRGFGPAGSHPE